MPSRTSIVASLAVAAGIILATASSPAAHQGPPRDRRPGEAAPETTPERDLKLALDGTKVDPYLELAKLQQARGALKDVEATLLSARKAFPADRHVLLILTGYYRQTGEFDKTAAVLEETARLDPSNKQAHQVVAAFYWERVSKDPSLTPEQKRSYIDSGLAATERALAIDADDIGALGYRGLLLRARAASEPNPATQQSLVAEADALGARAAELTKSKTLAASGSTVTASPSAPAIPSRSRLPSNNTGPRPESRRQHQGAHENQGRSPVYWKTRRPRGCRALSS